MGVLISICCSGGRKATGQGTRNLVNMPEVFRHGCVAVGHIWLHFEVDVVLFRNSSHR